LRGHRAAARRDRKAAGERKDRSGESEPMWHDVFLLFERCYLRRGQTPALGLVPRAKKFLRMIPPLRTSKDLFALKSNQTATATLVVA